MPAARKPKRKPVPVALAREALASARLDGETQVIEPKPLPTYHQVIAAIDDLIRRNDEAATAHYRNGGHGCKWIDRGEALEDARRVVKQLQFSGE